MPIYDFESPSSSPGPASGRRIKLYGLGALLIAVLASISAIRSKPAPDPVPAPPEAPSDAENGRALQPADSPPAAPADEWTAISGQIRKGEAFYQALGREGIDYAQTHELISAVRKDIHRGELNLNIVQRGDRYRLEIDSLGVVQHFEYIKRGARESRFLAKRENGRLKAWKEQVPLQQQVVVISGQLKDSLWNALYSTGENPDIISDKMRTIFEYYIDFMVDCRKNDRFSLAIEKYYKDGEFIRYGDILAAEYKFARESYQAFLYETPDGDTGYYDAGGKSLEGLFLKSPLVYRRISSRYSERRFHPILKKHIPHHGIDYAAPTGTPVWSTAAGVVAFIGRKGALGKYVEIQHKNGYKSGYGHLSAYRRNLKKGDRIKQKQIIGYVGATGRATGPHLHYNFFVRRNGKYRIANPAIVYSPTSRPLADPLKAQFLRMRDKLWALLDRQTGTVVTAFLDENAAPPPGTILAGTEAPVE